MREMENLAEEASLGRGLMKIGCLEMSLLVMLAILSWKAQEVQGSWCRYSYRSLETDRLSQRIGLTS
jgi:hypothetical protein